MSKAPMYQYRPEREDAGVTSGWMLRSTRELRNVTADTLSEITGIKSERIAAAEANLLRLDIEEIEKIAMVLDSHPSSFAFPYWDSLPFASEPIMANGRMQVNDDIQAGKFRVYLNREFGIDIELTRRKGLNIRTFNGAMATGERVYEGKKLRRSINYAISGDWLGSLNDIYAAGPDFDGDTRVVRELEITLKYSTDGITYLFRGKAVDIGMVSPGRPAESPPGDWTFCASFIVPLDKLRNFCGLYPEAAERLKSELSKPGAYIDDA